MHLHPPVLLRATLLAAIWIPTTSAGHAQSPTDDCASAPLIAATGSHFYDYVPGTPATRDGSSSCDPALSGGDVWLRFRSATSTRTRLFALSYDGADLHLSVHDGCPGSALNEVACNDDVEFAPSGMPHVEFEALANVEYRIRIADLLGASTRTRLYVEVDVDRPPRNDDPAHPVTIAPGTRLFEGTGAHSFDPLYPGLWFRYVPVASGPASANVCTISPLPTAIFDSVLCVFEGSTGLACDDDSGGCGTLSRVNWSVLAGHEYRICVADFWTPGGSFVLQLEGPPSATDGCVLTPSLTLGEQLLVLSGSGADGSSSCDAGTEPDMLYAFVAPTLGVLDVSTCGTDDDQGVDSGEDSVLSIHGACPGSPADEIACSDDAACALDQGQQVDARAGAELVGGSRVFVRVTRKGAESSIAPIRLTASFRPGVAFCAGDGSATACPCGNVGGGGSGCRNSAQAGGAALRADGVPDVAADTLTLRVAGMPASTVALFLQGTLQIAGGAGVVFGDGLRCVGGSVVRLGLRAANGGSASFGDADGTGTSIAVVGAVPVAGGLRQYQAWYRDAAPFCTSSTFNLTNGLTVQWGP